MMNPRIEDWRGLRVWIIGASTGIGAATAKLLLQRGAKVGLTARSVEALSEIANGHDQACVVAADITQLPTLRNAYQTLTQTWGGVDLTLVVAGTHIEMRADNFDLARAKSLFDVNVNGVLNCLSVLLPELCQPATAWRGIGVVASVAGYSGLPKALAYGASKAALINLTESLYFDLQPKGVAVYLINPGFVDTRLTQKNAFKMPALMSADEAAHIMLNGMQRGAFEIHFPKRFTRWLKLLRLLPYCWYFSAVRRFTGL
jgi:short-subunit dehydrogenase